MNTSNTHRRPPFLHRPWITGKLYDEYSRPTVLHCDAYIYLAFGMPHLAIEWREGGTKLIARDAYLIEPDGLTPIWDTELPLGRNRVYWTRVNNDWMARVHQRVLAEVRDVRFTRWPRIVFQAHYVRVVDSDCEIARNYYIPPKPYAPRASPTQLSAKADVPKRPRGRPRKNGLPDWL